MKICAVGQAVSQQGQTPLLTRRDILRQTLALAAAGKVLQNPLIAGAGEKEAIHIEPQTGAGNHPSIGVHLPLWHQGSLDPETYWPALFKNLKANGLNRCLILIYRFVDPVTGRISRDSRYKLSPSPSIDFLEAGMKAAQQNQIEASLYPMLEIDNNKNIGTVWRGYLNFFGSTLKNFFHQYNELIMNLAEISTRYQAGCLFIGSELASLTHNIGASPHWEQLIYQLNNHIKGTDHHRTRLSYAAHWEEYLTVPFWRQLDEIAINAYFPLSTEEEARGPNKPEPLPIRTAWNNNLLRLKNFAAQNQRPLILSEFGLTPYDLATARPWAQQPSKTKDLKEQHTAYEALLESLKKQESWLQSVYLWHWKMPERSGSQYNISPESPLSDLIKSYARSAKR